MKNYIKHWYPKDERFFRVLSIAGNIRNEDANKIDISNSRLKNFQKENLIKVVSYPSKYNQQITSNKSYCLTQKGKDFVAQKYNITRCQSSHAAEHNCKVAEVICNLNKSEISTVQSEWETRDQMQELLDNMRTEGDYDQYDYYMDLWAQGKISTPDIVYVSSTTQELVCCEVVTNNYKDADIEAKEVASEILETKIDYVNI